MPQPTKPTTAPAPRAAQKPAASPHPLDALQRLQQAWDKIPVVEYGAKLPDGTYIVRLAEVTTGTSSKEATKGQQFVILRYEVTEGDLAGQSHPDIFMLKDDETAGRFKGRLKGLGINYQDWKEMGAELDRLIADRNLYQITLMAQVSKTGKTYQNFTLDRAVETPADREAAESLGEQIDEQAVEEAEEAPVVQRTAAKAPPAKGGKRPPPPPQDAADLIGELE